MNETRVQGGRLLQPGGLSGIRTNMDFPIGGMDSEYHNLFGIVLNYGKYDKQKREQIYKEAVAAYPDSTDCATLDTYVTQIGNDIVTFQKKMASNCDKGCRQVNQRHVDALNQRLSDIKNQRATGNCDAIEKAANDSRFIDQVTKTVNGVDATPVGTSGDIINQISSGLKGLFGGGNSTTDESTAKKPNYLLYAGIGGAVIVAFIVIKKVL